MGRALHTWLLSVAMIMASMVALPSEAQANVGAGVGSSPIALATKAQPGGVYHLPPLYVVNTGTVVSSYRLEVESLSPGQGHLIPKSWIRFDRNNFFLGPGKSTRVGLILMLPAGVPTGNYVSDVVAGTVAAHRGPGAVAGAQAATKLLFTVAKGEGFPWPWPLWVYLLIVGLVVIVAVTAAWRRSGLAIRVERRS
jgi:hypothetical protein